MLLSPQPGEDNHDRHGEEQQDGQDDDERRQRRPWWRRRRCRLGRVRGAAAREPTADARGQHFRIEPAAGAPPGLPKGGVAWRPGPRVRRTRRAPARGRKDARAPTAGAGSMEGPSRGCGRPVLHEAKAGGPRTETLPGRSSSDAEGPEAAFRSESDGAGGGRRGSRRQTRRGNAGNASSLADTIPRSLPSPNNWVNPPVAGSGASSFRTLSSGRRAVGAGVGGGGRPGRRCRRLSRNWRRGWR